ncbi:carbamoyl-phosphate synthase small subunit [Planomicrobium soli]|uniref:Carbamoyl phosphate synthase small chain n=1 Tax=Planomicrobium soli TaxID=1176648 RepID=A0A2P8FT03_9BACL|nr:carbamoyl-phosphate synthase small subunit [Planomicrobium soli]
MKRYLILEDGTVFEGKAFGSEQASVGEIVFNTSMTGYQEILSDPSYCGQIVTMTYPMIGNYGINSDDFESISPAVKGLVVRELAEFPSNFRSNSTLDELFRTKNIPGISDIDTRKLTRLIRSKGAIKGILTAAGEEVDVEKVVQKLTKVEMPRDQVAQVSTARPYPSPGRGKRVVLIDYGMKHGILRELNNRDCDVIVVPYNTTSKEILAWGPDGVMLSNGPGDPKDVEECVQVVRELLGKVPVFGICLGHQLFARACGADTYKLKFGHRGGNHPVTDLTTGRVEITSQNHGYSVDENTLQGTRLAVTHTALNDSTIEGLKHIDYPAFTVQYHPESSPGPEDSNYLFDRFIEMMSANRKEQQYA